VQFIVFAAIAIALAYTVYVYYSVLRSSTFPLGQTLRNCLLLTTTATAVLFVIAILFLVTTLPDEPEDWWLDTGFYGGFIGFGVVAVMFWKAQRASKREQAAKKPDAASAPDDSIAE
jgi:uncharacterized protein YhhL (DUF1145 family)